MLHFKSVSIPGYKKGESLHLDNVWRPQLNVRELFYCPCNKVDIIGKPVIDKSELFVIKFILYFQNISNNKDLTNSLQSYTTKSLISLCLRFCGRNMHFWLEYSTLVSMIEEN